METLLQSTDKTEINKGDSLGLTALMYAALENKNPKIIEALIKHGANVKIKSKEGKTALDYAKDNPDIFRTDAYWLMNDKMYE